MAQIIAPNKDYSGESASVTFVKGVGETSDAYLIEWFKEHGYTVIEDEATEVQPRLLQPTLKPRNSPRKHKKHRRSRKGHVLQELKLLMRNEYRGYLQEAAKAGG